jgi:hypothetical protein
LKYLYLFWFFASTSDAIGAILAAWRLFRMNTRFSRYLAFLLVGIAVEAVIAGFSLLALWPDESTVAPLFAWSRIAGRTVKATTVWFLSLYLMGFMNGEKVTPKHIDETESP